MNLSAGVFCHNGLGDGINCLVLSNNLHLNGWKVDTYQNTVGSMQNWFPHLPVQPYPTLAELPRILNTYDYFFVVYNDTVPFVMKLIEEGKRRFPDRMKVIYLYASKGIVNEPYYTDCLTNHEITVAENLHQLCDHILHLPKLTRSNGFIPPSGLIPKKHPKRIAIHPTSSRLSRNWPKEKFIALSHSLKEQGFEPIFIPGEKAGWEDLDLAFFPTLDALARFLYESGYLVGNDSGLGHLASAVGVPTLTICRRKALAKMWAPAFQRGLVLTPSSFIPNIRGLRIRDRYWQKLISVNMAKRAFSKLHAAQSPLARA